MTRWAHSAVLAGLLLVAAPAFAQQPKDDTATAEAKLRFGEGIKLADAGDHEAARLKFNQAWALLKSPAIVYNLARSEQLSNHPVEALEHYRSFLRMSSDPKVTEAQKQRATENIADLTKKVAQIDVEAPSGARISIDSRSVEWSANAEPFPVLPGKHVVDAIIDGKPRSVTIECAAGTVTKAKLATDDAPVPTPPPTMPVVSSQQPEKTEAGARFWTTGRGVGLGLAGAGLLAGGAGILFQLQAGNAEDDYKAERKKLATDSACNDAVAEKPPACAAVQSKLDDKATAETLRTVFFISGGALLVGGVVLFLVSAPPSTKSALHFAPWASARDAGLTLFGSF